MSARLVVTVFSMMAVGAGCSLRKDLADGAGTDVRIDTLQDGVNADLAGPPPDLRPGADATPTGATGGNGLAPGGTAGSTGSGGSTGLGTGGSTGLGTAGSTGLGTGGATSGGTGGSPSGPDAATDGPLLMRGLAEACALGSDCTSGNCVDGVCCDSACASSCSACNLTDFVGHCSPIPAGGVAPSPHPACPKLAATTCQQDGLCDGAGACQLYTSGESCAGGACSAATQMSVTGSTCDGLGTCKPTPAVACAPFKCKADGTACATTCATDADCQGQPCVAGSCGKVANGNKCTSAGQCTSGSCVDGYCCDLACGGTCQACDLAGSIGKCTTLAANQTPRNGRAACAAGTCGSRCDGTSTSCAFAPKTTSCGAASCSGGTAKAAVSCDGMGACPMATTTSCGGYACSGTACKTTCAADADCLAPTPYCSGGKCQAAKPLGRACTTGSECAMGNCVNGVCCGTASCPACQACNLGTPGTCTGKPATATDSACSTANCQTGTCNGSGACAQAADGAMCGANRFCRGGTCGACTPNQLCQPPTNPCKTGTTSCTTGSMTCLESGNVGSGTPCGAAASCTGTTKTNAAVCNGSGTCAATTQSCSNGCNAAKTDCLTCSAGQTSCSGTCVDTTSNAAHCGASCGACGTATPICLNSTCVQCTSDSYCSGVEPSCDVPSHTCVCRRPSAGNVILNAGFDTNLNGWLFDPGTGVSWKSDDADGCAGSGSLYATDPNLYAMSPCLKVTPGVFYYFGFRYKHGITPDASVFCYLTPYKDSSCSTGSDEDTAPGILPSRSSTWSSASTTWMVYPDSPYAQVSCPLKDGSIDQVYLNPNANIF